MKINKKIFLLWFSSSDDLTRDISDMTEKRDIPREESRRSKHIIDRIISQKAVINRPASDLKTYRKVYTVLAFISAVLLISVLLVTVSHLPRYGVEHAEMNEVAQYYIDNGLKDTGATNIVAGMILDYRAFDTLGESFVLFTALNCVYILLRRDYPDEYPDTEYHSLTGDNILYRADFIVIPSVILFGIYIILNGHLSPGGGFSGGTMLGAGLILLSMSYGDKVSGAFMTDKLQKSVSFAALSFYCLAKSYSFFTGANEIKSIIPLGTPGAILSSGLILPLNIAVGLVVGCTVYGIYCMFRKGSL